jgi:hypothetical protein
MLKDMENEMSEEANNQETEVGGQRSETEGRTSGASGDVKAPRVFVSYSHDTPAHKQWVGELASKLVKKGVDVILDQWDLGLGDDVPKFMEKSVGEADRVLMICTESYVRKADGGRGGVGYEAMVVTGELVRKLETNKFIPIIRQSGAEEAVPRSVSTRLYVNLSEGQDFDEEFEKLLREIHNAPKERKPKLGQNPFVGEVGNDAPVVATASGVKVDDAGEMYAAGLALARRDDLMEWRKVVQKARGPLASNLIAWRARYDGLGPVLISQLPEIVSEAAAIYSPLISLAVAGAVSGNPRFSNQASILDEIIGPANWNGSGMTFLTQIPSALVFTFQAVHGAACLFSGQVMKAIMLSRARVRDSYSSEMEALFKQPPLVGWPHSFSERPDLAWTYLVGLSERWRWLTELFGSKEDYQAALQAYYLSLHVQELADLIGNGQEAVLESEQHMPLVPMQGLRLGSEHGGRAYRMLVHSPEEVREVWRTLGAKDAQIAGAWEKWLKLTLKVQCRGHFPSWRQGFAHSQLLLDIRPEGGK